MSKVNLIQYGLHRSGTNYTRALIEKNFSNALFQNNEYARSLPVHKHFRLYSNMNFVPESKYLHNFHYEDFNAFDRHVKDISGLKDVGYIVTVKEPYSWYISYCKEAAKNKWPQFSTKFINNQYMVDYSLFCGKWVDFSKQSDKVCIIRYEDILKDLSKVMKAVKEQFGLVKSEATYQNIQKVYKSKRFTKSRQTYYEKGSFQDQFSNDELLVLKQNLSKEVTEELGYLW